MTGLSERLYEKNVAFRDRTFKGIAYVLDKIGIRPSWITVAGILFMVLFILFIRKNDSYSLTFLLLSLCFDFLDGVLARYQKKSSDRGKYIDASADTFNSFLFVFGLAYGGFVNPLIMMLYAYFFLSSKLIRWTIYNLDYKSDWLFKPVAGFLPNLINYSGFMLFLWVLVFGHKQFLSWFFLVTAAILLVDSLTQFIRLLWRTKI